MNKTDMHRICHKAVELWGESLQTVVCMEEMAELMQSLSKNIRGMCDKSHIAEEIADVEIMLEQLKHMELEWERLELLRTRATGVMEVEETEEEAHETVHE